MRLVIFALALTLAACQSARLGGVEGSWASDDGVFIATFDNGAFTSRLTSTGETVVADGRYASTGGGLTLSWTSIAANQRRAAECVFISERQLSCTPSAGAPFTMTKGAAVV